MSDHEKLSSELQEQTLALETSHEAVKSDVQTVLETLAESAGNDKGDMSDSVSHTSESTIHQNFPDRFQSTEDSMEGGSPHDNVRRLSLASDGATDAETTNKLSRLNLSGNVISVTFYLPHNLKYTPESQEWERAPRAGTSALYDSLEYLASRESGKHHTLIGWTGEIDQPPVAIAPIAETLSVPLGRELPGKPKEPPKLPDLPIPLDARVSLANQLSLHHHSQVLPVFLPDEIGANDVHIFREQDRWKRYGEHELFPLFHYKEPEASDGRAAATSWKDYERMNEAFAHAVCSVYRPGDIVIIHDYQLLLLPRILRAHFPNAYMALFLHTPFPSSEIFRGLRTREDVLDGMLGADMIGFQTQSYTMHFKHCCEQLLHVMASDSGVYDVDAYTAFEIFPIGINVTSIKEVAFASDVDNVIDDLCDRKVFDDIRVIIGRDRLDITRGVEEKLRAFEVLLKKYPEWVGKVVLVQIISPSATCEPVGLRGTIEKIISKINGKYGSVGYRPIHYHPEYMPKQDYLALLRIADLSLVTSVRDGINTAALEFVICQRRKKSPLIISEFSGTAEVLEGAITINPWHLDGVAAEIHRTLSAPSTKEIFNYGKVYRTVKKNGVHDWGSRCVKRLIANIIARDPPEHRPLNQTALCRQYTVARRRLFMFDYDGTLTPIVNDPAAAVPTDELIRMLQTLASNPRNDVWIISGRDKDFLEQHLGSITGLGFSAEHGCFTRLPYHEYWGNITENTDTSWRQLVVEILNKHTAKVPGSVVEEKQVGLTWHYRQAEDQDLAIQQAKKCEKELKDTIASVYGVDVITGKANVEVRPRGVNKGAIVEHLVTQYGDEIDSKPEFVLCMGDDTTDEDMFATLCRVNLLFHDIFTVKVGARDKPTMARFYVPEPEDVLSAIAALVALDAPSEGTATSALTTQDDGMEGTGTENAEATDGNEDQEAETAP